MKIIIICLIIFSGAYSQELGLIIGRPTGISYRNRITSSTALDFQMGYDFEKSFFDIHGAYLFSQRSDINIEGYYLPFYFGPGGRIKYENDGIALGVKVPFGLYYKFRNLPFSTAFELGPCLNFGKKTSWNIVGGLSFRYIFGEMSPRRTDSSAETEPARRERR